MPGLLDNLYTRGGGSGRGIFGNVDWSALGPSLMALGAGIASGGAPGGGGWGAGLGRGFAGASDAMQNRAEMQQKQLAYALQLQEMKNQNAYQNSSLGIAQQNANTSENTRQDAIALRQDAAKLEQSKIGGALSLIQAGAPAYQKAKSEILSGRWNTATGSGTTIIQNMLLGAAKITGDNPSNLFETMLPRPIDSAEARATKLQLFENYMNNLRGSVSAGYPIYQNSLGSFDQITMPPQSGPATIAPKGGAPTQATMMGPRMGGGGGMIPPQAVQALKTDPALRAEFESKYGVSAVPYLGQ